VVRDAEPTLLIADVAALTGVAAPQLRSWEGAGLLHPRRLPNGTRLYGSEDVARVRLITRSLVNPGRRGSLRRLAVDLARGDLQPSPADYAGLDPSPSALVGTRYWRAVVESMPDIVVVCDLDGRVTAMNQALRALVGGTEPRGGTEPLPASLQELPLRWAALTGTQHRDLALTFPGQGGPTVRAVQDVSLQVGRGRTFGLVGESGSGKSTLARVVAGLLPASSGQVSLDGSDVTVVAQRRSRQTLQRLQMVFQSPEATLNPSERIGTTLARSVRALGGLRGEALRQRVLALAAAVNIDSTLLESYPRQLSGGQRQRVAIARAFAGDPELVLCDEPASALDVSVQAAILNLLVDIQERQGASYIFISHDLTVVRYLADDIGVMYLGRLVEVGPAERVFAPPFHPYTEMLFAAIPTLDFDRPPAATDVTAPPPVGEVQRMPQQAADGPQPVVGEVLAPGGCPFRLRCPRLLGPQCAEEPPWRETADGHRFLCWIPAETLAADQRALGTRP